MKPLTPKQEVQKVHPKAREYYDIYGERCVGIGLRTVLGHGETFPQAWANALANMKTKGRK